MADPRVTVVMPVRNEAAYIERSLGAVLAQDYPRERVEVLVVDGMSDDGTRDLVRAEPRVRLLDNPGRIVPTGLNAALAVASGDVIVRVDGHCEVEPSYVRRGVEALERDRVEAVGGPIETIGETPTARAIAVAMSSRFGVGGSAFRSGGRTRAIVDSVPFPAYTRDAIRRTGPFDEELVRNQDDEYNYRLRELGGSILLDPEVRSRYYARASLRSLWRQYLQYGLWKVRVLQKHPRQMSPRQFVPPAFVAALVVSAVLAAATSWGWIALAAAAGSYLLANLAATLITAAGRGWPHAPLLPVAYLLLHTGYGVGFLAGLVRFAGRWGDRVGGTPKPGSTGVWADASRSR